jgi:hypothetical protein
VTAEQALALARRQGDARREQALAELVESLRAAAGRGR